MTTNKQLHPLLLILITLTCFLSSDVFGQTVNNPDLHKLPQVGFDWAVHPEIKPIAKVREYEEDPIVFDSPIAERLWKEIIQHTIVDVSSDFAKELMTGGSFISLKDNCYLVTYDAVYHICPNKKVFEQFSPSNPPGNTLTSDFFDLPNGNKWALISTNKLSRGIISFSFFAVVITKNKNEEENVKATLLAHGVENSDDPQSDAPCGTVEDRKGHSEFNNSATSYISHSITKDVAGYASQISFTVFQQNCKTLKSTKLRENYIFSGSDFIKIRKN
ncbi:hypothetical protein [Solimicrobium silvestre]|nr:hypothetical protein [Solimicrobium silvestre]